MVNAPEGQRETPSLWCQGLSWEMVKYTYVYFHKERLFSVYHATSFILVCQSVSNMTYESVFCTKQSACCTLFCVCLCFNATIITHTVPKRTKSTNIWMSISLPLHVVQWFPFRQIWKDEARKLRKSGSRQGGENIMFNMRNSFKCLWGQICKLLLKGGCIIKKDSDVKTNFWHSKVSPHLRTFFILQNAIMVGVNSFLKQHWCHCTPATSLKRCSSRVPAMSSVQLKRLPTKPARGSQIGKWGRGRPLHWRAS